MKIEEFEKELQAIDKDLAIRPNNPPKRVLDLFPDADKIASITYCGEDVCVIPNHDIYDESSANYGVDLRQDGRFVKHRSRPDALKIVQQTLERLKNDKNEADAFFGRGDYSDAALRSKEPAGEVQLVDEVPIVLTEVHGESTLAKLEAPAND